MAEAFALLLEQEGYRVSTSSLSGGALLRRTPPRPRRSRDAVLSGLQLIEQMRNDDELNDIPVVAVTASMHRAHGVQTVKKPFAGSGLLEAAKYYCGAIGGASAPLAGASGGVS